MRLIEEDARARENLNTSFSGFFRGDKELYEYNADELNRGEFYQHKQILKGKMLGALANILCEIFLFFWLLVYFPQKPSQPIRLVEHKWMLIWIFTQSVSFNIMLFGAIYAYNHP